jgi:hypothetical protein
MANLSKEDIARIYGGQQVGPNEYYDPQSGRTYTFRNGPGKSSGGGGEAFAESMTYEPQEILATDWAPGRFKDNAEMNGQSMDRYSMGGDYLGSETITGLTDRNQFMDIAKVLAAPVAMYGLQAAGLLGGANPVLGAEAGLTGGGGTSSLMGGAGADAIGTGTFNAAMDSQLANAAMGAEAFATPAMTSAAMLNTPTIAGASAGMSGLIPSLDTALKVGGTVAGAVAGSKGVESESSTKRQTDPRVDPYLFGDDQTPGLLKLTQQQLARDTSPQAQALWESMKSKGMGLMNQPMAPNGFNLLTRGRYQ